MKPSTHVSTSKKREKPPLITKEESNELTAEQQDPLQSFFQ